MAAWVRLAYERWLLSDSVSLVANPNSLITRLRIWLANHLDPMPDPGEGWCIRCSLNGGRTLLTSADGMRDHAEAHGSSGCRYRITLVMPAEDDAAVS